MRRILLTSIMLSLFLCVANAQRHMDFALRYMKGIEKGNANVECITVSPKMMEEVHKQASSADKENDEYTSSLSHVRSFHVIVTKKDREKYYKQATDLLHKDSKTYQLYNGAGKHYTGEMWTRNNGENIVELIILPPENDKDYLIVNFTGDLNKDIINQLIKL